YVILAVLGAPALIQLGVNEVAAHMFVFYFGVMSGLTPPVAITAYTTAGIAGSNPLMTSVYSMRIGMGGFFIPFIFAYNPILLMQGGTTIEMSIAIFSAFLSCILFAGALEDYFFGRLGALKRIIMFVSALLLVVPGILTDLIGLSIAITILVWQKKYSNRLAHMEDKKLAKVR